jgi:hypothetical protein
MDFYYSLVHGILLDKYNNKAWYGQESQWMNNRTKLCAYLVIYVCQTPHLFKVPKGQNM